MRTTTAHVNSRTMCVCSPPVTVCSEQFSAFLIRFFLPPPPSRRGPQLRYNRSANLQGALR